MLRLAQWGGVSANGSVLRILQNKVHVAKIWEKGQKLAHITVGNKGEVPRLRNGNRKLYCL